eukprot:1588464-Rhodomonas_salina.2
MEGGSKRVRARISERSISGRRVSRKSQPMLFPQTSSRSPHLPSFSPLLPSLLPLRSRSALLLPPSRQAAGGHFGGASGGRGDEREGRRRGWLSRREAGTALRLWTVLTSNCHTPYSVLTWSQHTSVVPAYAIRGTDPRPQTPDPRPQIPDPTPYTLHPTPTDPECR